MELANLLAHVLGIVCILLQIISRVLSSESKPCLTVILAILPLWDC